MSFISPCQAERQAVRLRFPRDEFLEVFVDAPLAVAEKRDPKGLYKRLADDELANFAGSIHHMSRPTGPRSTSTRSACRRRTRRAGSSRRWNDGAASSRRALRVSGLRMSQPRTHWIGVALLLLALHRYRRVGVDRFTVPLGRRNHEHLADYLRHAIGVTLDGADDG